MLGQETQRQIRRYIITMQYFIKVNNTMTLLCICLGHTESLHCEKCVLVSGLYLYIKLITSDPVMTSSPLFKKSGLPFAEFSMSCDASKLNCSCSVNNSFSMNSVNSFCKAKSLLKIEPHNSIESHFVHRFSR